MKVFGRITKNKDTKGFDNIRIEFWSEQSEGVMRRLWSTDNCDWEERDGEISNLVLAGTKLAHLIVFLV